MSIKIEHRLGVQASPDRIWEVLSHLETWHGWNPAYPEAAGKIAIGGVLNVTETLPHLQPAKLAPVVVDWVPREQLVWRVKEGPFTRRLQFFEIEALTDQGCIVSIGVIFQGWGMRSVARQKGRSFKLGLGLLAEALKAKAESN